MFTIIDFDPFEADGRTWKDYFNFCKTVAGAYLTKDEFKEWLKEDLNGKPNKFKLIYRDNDLVIAMMSYSKKRVSGNEIPGIALESIVNDAPKELSKIVATVMLQLMNNNPVRSFRITTANPLIREIITGFGGKVINTKNFYELYRNQLNEEVMNKWRANSYMESGDLRLVIHEHVPEESYNQFAVLITELMNDIMREESEELFTETGEGIKRKMELLKKNRIKMLTLLLFDLKNQLIGISFIQLFPGSVIAKQYMTGVKKPYRGKKLASYLKALITEEAFRRFPDIEKIETDCYDANKPMIHINELTGYSLKERSFQFSVEVEKVEEFLAAD